MNTPRSADALRESWPPLPYEDWEPTKQTLHRYAQIVGKIRMALVPRRLLGCTPLCGAG